MAGEVELADQVFAEVDAYLSAPWDGRESYVLDVAHNLLNSVLKQYQNLKFGYEKDTALEAWACRNLLELDVCVRYVLKSESNARRFVGDVTIDGIDIFESLKKWMEYVSPASKNLELNETLRLAYERRDAEGLTGEKHLNVRALAKEVGMEDDYEHTFKLCSKLVHPTAFSVLSMNDDGEYAQFREILFHAGMRYGVDAFTSIRDHRVRAA
ncbi:MAG: DUF5677 domain-containing protein [Terriglobales bacterium]|jgi:hypothetical protein